ncbi:methyltransferase domain-containing protein [Sphaerotilus sp.]|uniref:class I SAM-dependent methyltransferase n=1 Tax=Sphaerotilus sp. TaxID=2093942 RepID=UPI00286E28DA|nr:methyltransferase domain-containing protein [Sphaerotilus sp.]
MEFFLREINPQPLGKILDVGGTPYNWNLIGYKNEVVLLNILPHEGVPEANNFIFVTGDGTNLEYSDNQFDIVFSNSVIEHVGSYQKQKDFARELCRVGTKIWLQTPAREFFFEPHYVTPFIHWLPKTWQKRLLRNFSFWGIIARPSRDYIDAFVDQTRLLGYEEMVEFFPGKRIIREKFLFMTKAYIVTN